MNSYDGYTDTCRVCLKKEPQMKLTIFDTLNDNITYGDMLTLVLHPLPIDMHPKLPQKLCQMCKDNLVKVFNLRQLCFTSDRWIKSTIYGDDYLNANGYAVGNYSTPNDTSFIETLVVQDDDEPDSSSIPALLLSSCLYDAPEIILPSDGEPELEMNEATDGNPEQGKHKCEMCWRKFSTPKGYLRHKMKKHEHKCEFCDILFTKDSALKIHFSSLGHIKLVKDLIGDSEYVCIKCRVGFSCIKEYSKHMLKHMVVRIEAKDTMCKLCNHRFASKYALKRHLARVHKITE